MTLSEVIEQYILWRQAHGAKFTTRAGILRRFLRYADGDLARDAVTTTQVLAVLAGNGPLTRHRENKYYALAGFWRYAISRGYATSLAATEQRTEIAAPELHRIFSHYELRRFLTRRPWRAAGAVRFSSTQ